MHSVKLVYCPSLLLFFSFVESLNGLSSFFLLSSFSLSTCLSFIFFHYIYPFFILHLDFFLFSSFSVFLSVCPDSVISLKMSGLAFQETENQLEEQNHIGHLISFFIPLRYSLFFSKNIQGCKRTPASHFLQLFGSFQFT